MEKYTQTRAVFFGFACLPRAEEVFWHNLYLKPAVYSELIGLSHLVIWDSECVNFARGISSGPQITDQSRGCSLLSRAHVSPRVAVVKFSWLMWTQSTSALDTQHFLPLIQGFCSSWLIWFFVFGTVQRPLTVSWRYSGLNGLIASTARAAWPGCWKTGEEQSGWRAASEQMGFYLLPPLQEEKCLFINLVQQQ